MRKYNKIILYIVIAIIVLFATFFLLTNYYDLKANNCVEIVKEDIEVKNNVFELNFDKEEYIYNLKVDNIINDGKDIDVCQLLYITNDDLEYNENKMLMSSYAIDETVFYLKKKVKGIRVCLAFLSDTKYDFRGIKYNYFGAKHSIFTIPIIFLFLIVLIYCIYFKISKYLITENKIPKKHIDEFNFVRVVAEYGILIFHYSCYLTTDVRFLYTFRGVHSYGAIFTMSFIILSGIVLEYAYEDVNDVKGILKYYLKRIVTIFPMFYLCFIFFYVYKVIAFGNVFYGGSIKNIFLTIIGMDGYLAYKIPSYCVVGDWFLGALLILYLVYPALKFTLKHYISNILAVIVLVYVYTLGLKDAVNNISPYRNVLCLLLPFFIGMMLTKYKLILYKYFYPIAIIVLFVFITIFYNYISIDVIILQLYGFLFLFIFALIGKIVVKSKIINEFLVTLNKIALPLFLIEHAIILPFLAVPILKDELLIRLIVIIIAATLFSEVFYYLNNQIKGLVKKVAE